MNLRSLIREIITESTSMKVIRGHLKGPVPFGKLPRDYQLAIVIYCQECKVSWDGVPEELQFGGSIDWVRDMKTTNTLIKNYNKEFGKERFLFGVVPMELITKRVGASVDKFDDAFSTFDDWHKHYRDTGGAVDHGNSVLPIIMADNGHEGGIDDGWHRFNSYVAKGLKAVPVVMWA